MDGARFEIFFNVNPAWFYFISASPSTGTTIDTSVQPIKWEVGKLSSGNTATLIVTVKYLPGGVAQDNLMTLQDMRYEVSEEDPHPLDSYQMDVDLCPACCGRCDNSYTTVSFKSCEDIKEQTAEVILTEEGNVLLVNLKLPRVCANRDVAILVMVNEVENDGTESPIAHRVITRRWNPTAEQTYQCTNTLDCYDMIFAIPGGECSCLQYTPSCEEREFRIRTVAHYVYPSRRIVGGCENRCNITACPSGQHFDMDKCECIDN